MTFSEKYRYWAHSVWQQCKAEGLMLEPGVPEMMIWEAEKELGILFPDSFVELYRQVNGFRDSDMNANLFSIWPVQKILDLHRESPDPEFIGFCDFLINSHEIGFLRGEKGIYKSYDQVNAIADSFEQAIDLINGNADCIY